jgi:hypothetical protein
MVRSPCSKTLGAEILYVSCASARTFEALRRMIKPAALYLSVLYLNDDYVLAVREPWLRELVRSLEPKIVVVYPPAAAYEELEGLEKIEMPPYALEELEDICRERAARLALARASSLDGRAST